MFTSISKHHLSKQNFFLQQQLQLCCGTHRYIRCPFLDNNSKSITDNISIQILSLTGRGLKLFKTTIKFDAKNIKKRGQ